ncbi:MAG: DUF1801 domain-containing protein [Thermomicrobiales bacterium]
MSAKRIAAIDDYLASLDAVKAETVGTVVDTILTEFPETESVIAWNVPHVKLGKDYLFGISAAKNHLSLNPWSQRVISEFRTRLEPEYVVLQSIFQVPVDWKVDRALLADLVRARIAELDRS